MAAHGAFRDACAGDVGDAAHGAGEPAVVELQGAAQVGARAAIGMVPSLMNRSREALSDALSRLQGDSAPASADR